MSETEEKTDEAAVDTIVDETNEVAVLSEDGVKEIVARAQEMQPTGEELVTNYYKFEIGEEMKLLPLGLKRIEKQSPSQADWDNKRDDEDKPMTDAIRFLNCDDGMFYINADSVMVSTLNKHAVYNEDEANTEKRFFVCQALRKKKSDKGEYIVFSIIPLS